MSAAWNLVPVSTAAWTAMEVTSATVWTVTHWHLTAPAPVSNIVLQRAKSHQSCAFNRVLSCVWNDVCRLQDMRSRSLSVWLWGGPGGDPLPLPVSRAAARTGRKNLCRWGTRFWAFLLISRLLTFTVGLRQDDILTSALHLILRADVIRPCLSAGQGLL